MLFDIAKVKENKIKARKTRSQNFLIKKIFFDFESRVLELGLRPKTGIIEGCRQNDLSNLGKNKNLNIFEFLKIEVQNSSLDFYASLLQLHWSNNPYKDLSERIKYLKPEGKFLCCLFGSETLKELRDCFFEAEMNLSGNTSLRISPLPEIRDVGNLANNVGLKNTVVDKDILKVEYKKLDDLFIDLKRMGETNAAVDRRKTLTTKTLIQEVKKLYLEKFSKRSSQEPKRHIIATFEVIFLYGNT
ncbi:hypothetical protein OA005_00215 [Paracoccaceae bacterium]|nr:hypothetical protein [Paracoccaceae bacterium]